MSINEKISQMINDSRIMVFMKGTPEMPQCGFSKAVIDVLKHYKAPFNSFDVLADDEVRQGIKDYSDWPTIPQIYINGEFVGGCDIVLEMHNKDQLAPMLASN